MMTVFPFGWIGRGLSANWSQAALVLMLAGVTGLGGLTLGAQAQEPLPWQRDGGANQEQYGQGRNDQGQAYGYRNGQPPYRQAQGYRAPDPYSPNGNAAPPQNDAYRPPQSAGRNDSAPRNDTRDPPPRYVEPYRAPRDPARAREGVDDRYQPDDDRGDRRYGNYDGGRYDGDRRDDGAHRMPDAGNTTYSENEVIDAGHRFFGSLSNGLAKAVQWAFKKSGRPNGYILGEDAGGAFIAGLRYGEGKLYTKNHGVRRVFWQGPSIGYDFGGDGNRTMTLVYNLRSPGDVYRRFGGVQGSAYLVGGVSVQLLTGDDITVAPIRTGVGLRLGANIGYLKYTRHPTWNPF